MWTRARLPQLRARVQAVGGIDVDQLEQEALVSHPLAADPVAAMRRDLGIAEAATVVGVSSHARGGRSTRTR
jgi:hypothetical protein